MSDAEYDSTYPKYKCPDCGRIDHPLVDDMTYHANIFCTQCGVMLNLNDGAEIYKDKICIEYSISKEFEKYEKSELIELIEDIQIHLKDPADSLKFEHIKEILNIIDIKLKR